MSTHGELRLLVERYGDRVLRHADDLRATLDDFFGESETISGEINLLVDAVRLGANDHLLSMLDNGVAARMAIDTAGARLAESRGGNHRSSCWAVAVIGHALGRISEADVLAYQSQPGLTAQPPQHQAPAQTTSPPPAPPAQEPTIYRGGPAAGVAPGPALHGQERAPRGYQQDAWPPSSTPRTASRNGLWVALAVVVIAALVVGGVVLLNRTDSSVAGEPESFEMSGDVEEPERSDEPEQSEQPEEPEDTGGVRACGSEPEMQARDVTNDSFGVTVALELHATCTGGQYLDARTFDVEITGGSGDLFASAAFDFSGDPLWVPDPVEVPAGSTVQAYFPVGTFWIPPADLFEEVSRGRVSVAGDAGGSSSGAVLPAPDDTSSGDMSEVQASGSGADPAVSEQASEDALPRQVRLDEPKVSARFVDRWVPQLSSKSYDRYDDVEGITYHYDDIYRDHLQLRLAYPDARLLWSGDWASYESADFWVTVAGETFPTGDGALDWCVRNGFDGDHCYAKRIIRSGSSEGTSLLQD